MSVHGGSDAGDRSELGVTDVEGGSWRRNEELNLTGQSLYVGNIDIR